MLRQFSRKQHLKVSISRSFLTMTSWDDKTGFMETSLFWEMLLMLFFLIKAKAELKLSRMPPHLEHYSRSGLGLKISPSALRCIFKLVTIELHWYKTSLANQLSRLLAVSMGEWS